MNFWWPLKKFSKKSKSTTSWWYYLTINVKNLFVSILCGIDKDNFLCIYGITCLNMQNTGSTCCNHPEDTNWVCSTPLGCKVKAHMMPNLCKLWDEHSASGLFVNVPRGITSVGWRPLLGVQGSRFGAPKLSFSLWYFGVLGSWICDTFEAFFGIDVRTQLRLSQLREICLFLSFLAIAVIAPRHRSNIRIKMTTTSNVNTFKDYFLTSDVMNNPGHAVAGYNATIDTTNMSFYQLLECYHRYHTYPPW